MKIMVTTTIFFWFRCVYTNWFFLPAICLTSCQLCWSRLVWPDAGEYLYLQWSDCLSDLYNLVTGKHGTLDKIVVRFSSIKLLVTTVKGVQISAGTNEGLTCFLMHWRMSVCFGWPPIHGVTLTSVALPPTAPPSLHSDSFQVKGKKKSGQFIHQKNISSKFSFKTGKNPLQDVFNDTK